jgi:phosphate acetyltransferase
VIGGGHPRLELRPVASPASPSNAPDGKYDRLIARARAVSAATTLIVYPCDETSLRGATEAAEAGIIQPILVGPVHKINAAASEHGLDISHFEIIDVPHSKAAAATAVQLVHEAKGDS